MTSSESLNVKSGVVEVNISDHFLVRDRSLFMPRGGTEEKMGG